MIIKRKFGKLVRGRANPFQIFSASILGMLIGFVPGFQQAPGLLIFWLGCLIILNANLFLAGLIGILGKLLLIALMRWLSPSAGFSWRAQPIRYSLLWRTLQSRPISDSTIT